MSFLGQALHDVLVFIFSCCGKYRNNCVDLGKAQDFRIYNQKNA